MAGPIRTFDSGATRDNAEGKPDYVGFESALVSKRFAKYMDLNRKQPDGSVRGSDNWKRGIPQKEYLVSLSRHMKDLELHAEGFPAEAREDVESALCAIIFNARGMLYEILKDKYNSRNALGQSTQVGINGYGPFTTTGYIAPPGIPVPNYPYDKDRDNPFQDKPIPDSYPQSR